MLIFTFDSLTEPTGEMCLCSTSDDWPGRPFSMHRCLTQCLRPPSSKATWWCYTVPPSQTHVGKRSLVAPIPELHKSQPSGLALQKPRSLSAPTLPLCLATRWPTANQIAALLLIVARHGRTQALERRHRRALLKLSFWGRCLPAASYRWSHFRGN